MSSPRTGSKYTYSADRGLADRATGDTPLHPEMRDLDLPPGTTVTVHGYDAERDLIIVEWSDANRPEHPRLTSIEPDEFATNFTKG